CPFCGQQVQLQPGEPTQDLTCPNCRRSLTDVAITAGGPLAPKIAAHYSGLAGSGDPGEPNPLEAVRLPGTVMAGSIIWIVFGSLVLIISVSVLLAFVVTKADGPASDLEPCMTCGPAFVSLFAPGFIFAGVWSLRGVAKDPLGVGIESLIFGVIFGA